MITCLAIYPIIDVVLGFIWFLSLHMAWKNATPAPDKINAPEERALGAAVIMGQLSSIITGASIVIAGIAAFVALGNDHFTIPQSYHLFWATLWSVAALGVSLYTMSMLPTRTFRQNFTNSSEIAKFSAMALYFALAGGVRLMLAVSVFLFKT